MHLILTSMVLILPSMFSASISAQGLTQNQTCANACTVADACNHQCHGTGDDIVAYTDVYTACLCQTGCLCNAEICLQCCEADGNYDPDFPTCGLANLAAGDVINYCSVQAPKPSNVPARSCFVYGEGEDGGPTSTYASNSPFPTSVETLIAGLLPLRSVTVASSSLVTGTVGAASPISHITGNAGTTSGKVSAPARTTTKADTTTLPSQETGQVAAAASTSPLTTSASASSTGQPSATSQNSGAKRTWPMFAKGYMLILPSLLGPLLL